MNLKELYQKDQKSFSPPITKMFKNDNKRKEVSKMLSVKIEFSKMSKRNPQIPTKDKKFISGAKQSIAKGVYDPIEMKYTYQKNKN